MQVLVFEGVEEQDFVGPLEVFGQAKDRGNPVTVTLVTAGPPQQITARFGTRIQVATGWSPRDADVLVVPGGGYVDKVGVGVRQMIAQPEVKRKLADAHAAGVCMAGVCTGVMLLSAAGLIRERPCTTHWGARADLAAQGGKLIDARVVDDGDLLTCGGITSGLDLGLWLVERHFGAPAAANVEKFLEYERRGTVWHR